MKKTNVCISLCISQFSVLSFFITVVVVLIVIRGIHDDSFFMAGEEVGDSFFVVPIVVEFLSFELFSSPSLDLIVVRPWVRSASADIAAYSCVRRAGFGSC